MDMLIDDLDVTAKMYCNECDTCLKCINCCCIDCYSHQCSNCLEYYCNSCLDNNPSQDCILCLKCSIYYTYTDE